MWILGDRGRLTKDAVPSVFPFRDIGVISPRMDRMQKRQKRCDDDVDSYQGIQNEIEMAKEQYEKSDKHDDEELPIKEAGVQYELPVQGSYSIENYKDNPKAVSYYTGFSSYNHFKFLFHCLGPAVFDLNPKCAALHPTDQLFLTLMKLGCAKEDIELSLFFKISESTVSRVIITWIFFLYHQLEELKIWPAREIVDSYMPTYFKAKFPSTRVILDATEVPIQKPSDVNIQSAIWSSYKHHNTVKTMIGCTPWGTNSYVSDTFAGSVSDRQIIENSPQSKST